MKGRDWLNYLNRLQPGLRVQRFIRIPKPWIAIDSSDFEGYVKTHGEVNHREIMIYEVVIDVDADMKSHGFRHANLVEIALKEKRFKYKRYKSGGTGEHFHIWFYKGGMTELLKKYELGTVRKAIIKYLVNEENLKPPHLKSHICLHNKTLIQIEGVLHRKGGTKTLVSQVNGINKVPPPVFNLLDKNYKTKRQQSLLRNKIKNKYGSFKPRCIDFLEGKEVDEVTFGQVGDGYNRAMFFLTSYYKHTKSDEWIVKYLNEYKKLRKFHMNATITNMVKSNTGGAGCPSRQDFLEELSCVNICKGCPYNVRVNFTEE